MGHGIRIFVVAKIKIIVRFFGFEQEQNCVFCTAFGKINLAAMEILFSSIGRKDCHVVPPRNDDNWSMAEVEKD